MLTLTTAGRAGGHEDAGILARERALRPEAASLIPEGLKREEISSQCGEWRGKARYLPLAGEVAEPRGDAHDECVVGGERGGIDDGVVGFGWGVHFREHFLR